MMANEGSVQDLRKDL